MNGIGNDRIDIQGTLDPDDAGQADRLGHPHADRQAASNVSRSQPFDWKAQGFLVGQPVQITASRARLWKVVGFTDDVRRRHHRQHA